MKMLHVVLFAVTVLSLGSCRKQTAANLTPNPNETAPPEIVAPLSIPDTEQAPVAEVAPQGVYFLRSATSVETANGRASFQPGTRLKQVSPGNYTAQGQTLALRDDQVTNDLKLVRQLTAPVQSGQTGHSRERQEQASEAAAISPETARQLDTDPQYQALSERAANLRSKIERVSREVSRIPNTSEKDAPAAAALRKEREKLEGELRAVTDEQTLLRTSK